MHIPTFIKYIVLAWVVPIAMVIIAITLTPDSNQNRSDFTKRVVSPKRVWIASKNEIKGADFFELRIKSQEDEEYFHRDPERGPISDLEAKLFKQTELEILYSPGLEGNVLMEIVARAPQRKNILSFDTIMGEYASRRRLIYIVAGIWCTLINAFSFLLWKVDISEPDEV